MCGGGWGMGLCWWVFYLGFLADFFLSLFLVGRMKGSARAVFKEGIGMIFFAPGWRMRGGECFAMGFGELVVDTYLLH